MAQYGFAVTTPIPTNNPALGKPGVPPNTDEMEPASTVPEGDGPPAPGAKTSV